MNNHNSNSPVNICHMDILLWPKWAALNWYLSIFAVHGIIDRINGGLLWQLSHNCTHRLCSLAHSCHVTQLAFCSRQLQYPHLHSSCSTWCTSYATSDSPSILVSCIPMHCSSRIPIPCVFNCSQPTIRNRSKLGSIYKIPPFIISGGRTVVVIWTPHHWLAMPCSLRIDKWFPMEK